LRQHADAAYCQYVISGEIFNLRTTARGKCTGGPARACLAAGAKSLVGFCNFLFARHRKVSFILTIVVACFVTISLLHSETAMAFFHEGERFNHNN
jgi:hypothetical protein